MKVNELELALRDESIQHFLRDGLVNGFSVQIGFETLRLERDAAGWLPECKLKIDITITNVYNPYKEGFKVDIYINDEFQETKKLKGLSIAEILLKNRGEKE